LILFYKYLIKINYSILNNKISVKKIHEAFVAALTF